MTYGNPYYSSGYYNNVYPTYQGNIMQPQQQCDTPIQAVKFVTSDEAKAYIVSPNQRIMLIDKDNSIFYIKGADAMGQSYTSGYKFEPINDSTIKIETESNKLIEDFVKKDDIKDFVTSNDLQILKTELTKSIDDLKKSTARTILDKNIKSLYEE